MFSFFAGGGFSHVLKVEAVGDVAAFKARVDAFFSRFVPTLKQAAHSIGVLERFMAIRFLPLEPKVGCVVAGCVKISRGPKISRKLNCVIPNCSRIFRFSRVSGN